MGELMSYVDTSVVVAALDPLDPRIKKAREFLEKEGNKIISEIALVELASVLARREEIISGIAKELGLDKREAIITLLIYIIKRFNLKYRSMDSETLFPLLGRMYKPMAEAVELSTQIKLRTLDLLHITYAKLIRDSGEFLQEFVTADTGFKKISGKLEEKIGLKLNMIT